MTLQNRWYLSTGAMRMNRTKRPLGRSSEGVAADLLYAKSNESEEKAPRFHCETWATRTSRIRRISGLASRGAENACGGRDSTTSGRR